MNWNGLLNLGAYRPNDLYSFYFFNNFYQIQIIFTTIHLWRAWVRHIGHNGFFASQALTQFLWNTCPQFKRIIHCLLNLISVQQIEQSSICLGKWGFKFASCTLVNPYSANSYLIAIFEIAACRIWLFYSFSSS